MLSPLVFHRILRSSYCSGIPYVTMSSPVVEKTTKMDYSDNIAANQPLLYRSGKMLK